VSDRHPGLRTEFKDDAGQIQQRGRPDWPVKLVEIDASAWSEERLFEAARAEAHRPFDLALDATLHVALFRRAADHHILIFSLPHIVGDLWSLLVLLDELRLTYTADIAGEPAGLPPLPLSYEDYVRAQRTSDDTYAGALAYWRDALAGELPVLDLPADRQRPATQSFRGDTIFRDLDAALTRDLERLAMKEQTTLFTLLLTAYQVLLHRYSGQDVVIVGMPTAGRQQAGLADVIGDFINMLPVRASFAEDRSFRQCLAATHKTVLDAIKHQECPFSAIVDAIEPPRDVSRTPIFQTTFVLQKFHRYTELQSLFLPGPDERPAPFANLLLEPWPMAQQDGQFDLNLEMKKSASGALMAAWKFAADLFDHDTIDRIASSFEALLRQMVDDPDRAVGALSLLADHEIPAVLAAGRGPIVEPPAETTVCALFEARAATHGDAIAIACGDASLTYAALQRRVDAVARSLAARGVGRETLVAVVMRRGLDFVTALLAVIKAGGGFLPLDPRNPPARSRTVLETSGLTMVLTESAFATELAASLSDCPEPPPVVAFETLAGETSDHPLPPAAAGGDLAYTMYTSGSTGQPKGVMVEHRGMVNHVLGKLADLGFGPADTLAQNAPQSFDVVVWQSLAPLVSGGQVIVIPDAIAEDPAALIAEISRRGVTMLQIVPSMLRAILEEAEACNGAPPDLAPLRWMIPTGEALPTELCRRWFALYPGIPILNTYGSTECSDDQCHYRLDRLDPADAAVPIVSVGRPIANMTAHVLDARLAPVPAGVVGELYIGGVGVGRGYRGDAERTAAAFIPDPHGSSPDARLYRTRDMARRRGDGLIDFLGRTDHMIKLHGLRIEPGEIENALCRHPDVAEAAVLARPGPAGDRRLVAYVVPADGGSAVTADVEILRPFLAASLPFSMIPSTLVLLPALPLTANGKLDQKRLPTPEWSASDAGPLIAPRNGIESTIAAIWGHLLKRDTISVTEDFFVSGGDSIRSIQVAARCRQAGLPIEPVDLFVHRTIAALAEYLGDRFSDGGWAAPTPVDAAVAELLVAPETLERALAMVSFDSDESEA
jgi:amino acid adenylation domain-containing protein